MNPFSSLDDEALMLKYKEGEFMAFEVLYDRHKKTIYTYVDKRVNAEIRDDIFQKIFLKVHKQREKFNPQYSFKKWLYVISRSVLLDHLKSPKNKRVHKKFNDELIGRSETPTYDFINDFQSFQELNAKEKQVVSQRILYDEEFATIAKSLKINVANTRKILSRALGKLKKRFAAER
mgnify:CR=1 FL=1